MKALIGCLEFAFVYDLLNLLTLKDQMQVKL